MARHRRDPITWDAEGSWDGRVVHIRGVGFVRYQDRNGDVWFVVDSLPAAPRGVPEMSLAAS